MPSHGHQWSPETAIAKNDTRVVSAGLHHNAWAAFLCQKRTLSGLPSRRATVQSWVRRAPHTATLNVMAAAKLPEPLRLPNKRRLKNMQVGETWWITFTEMLLDKGWG